MSLADAFARAAADDRALLMPYLMAGIPEPESSVDMFVAMAEAGADAFEIGLPYADPLMDGPVIQAAGARALANGMTLARGLEVVAGVRAATGLPCTVMTYVNPVMARGVGTFAADVAAAGGEAMILADLPVDEAAEFADSAAREGVGLVLFVAPTTSDDRLAAVVSAGPPFIYGIAEMGVTGERREASSVAAALSSRVRAVTDLPLVLGVGISGAEQARSAAGFADGVIVGSALVRRVLEAPDPDSAASALAGAVADLRAAVIR